MTRYTVVLSPDPVSEVYTVVCPAMPGAITEGTTREEALQAMALVMEAWLELAERDGFGPAPESPALIAEAVRMILDDRLEMGWDLVIETSTLAPSHRLAA